MQDNPPCLDHRLHIQSSRHFSKPVSLMMQARDLMTTSVVSIALDEPVQRIAQLLLDHGISAVPVVDGGVPVGIVSEHDIIARCCAEVGDRRAWFVRLISGNDARQELVRGVRTGYTARDVMTAPVITTSPEADASEVSRLMLTYNIKRLPVVRAGRMVGILSRADLLRAVAASDAASASSPGGHSVLGDILLKIDQRFQSRGGHRQGAPGLGDAHGDGQERPEPPHVFTAKELRAAVAHHKEEEARARAEERRQRRERELRDVDSLLGKHLTEDTWRHILLDASHAAANGEKEIQILRMPHQACTDNGRMINIGDHGWPSTLRGEAAEIWTRWDNELRPRGLRLVARTLEYPDGVPGDIGLFLVWGE